MKQGCHTGGSQMVATNDKSTPAPQDPPTPAIEVRGLAKSYDDRQVVDGVDLVVPAGSVVALLGPNGAGKTTTVECIEGFRRPDAGTVRVLGLDPIRQRAAMTPRLGIMLQEGGVWQAASPREVLRLYARLHPRHRDPEELLERLALGPVAGSKFRNLSGGEKQRLNLALALVGLPEVLILDEPTTGMDPEVRQQTWALLQDLRDDGVSILLTTHFMREAEVLADQVAVMARGRMLQQDSPGGLVDRFAPAGVTITSSATFDVGALSRALGQAVVNGDGTDRWTVAADAARSQELMGQVTAWFNDQHLPLLGISTGGEGLESAYLELTRQAFGEPVRLSEGASR